MIIKFRKTHPDAVAPQRMTSGAAGYDLTAVEVHYDEPTDTFVYSTGLAVEIPQGYVGLLYPRSSIYKTGLTLTNCVGVIDSDYRGTVALRFRMGADVTCYSPGDRIGQLVVTRCKDVQWEECEQLSDTDRGAGGFGSTNK